MNAFFWFYILILGAAQFALGFVLFKHGVRSHLELYLAGIRVNTSPTAREHMRIRIASHDAERDQYHNARNEVRVRTAQTSIKENLVVLW